MYKLLIGCLLFATACNSHTAQFPDDLAGVWKMDMDGINAEDKWTKVNDSVLVCESFIEGNKTESILLVKKGRDWLYVSTAISQTDGEPVKYMLSKQTKNTFTFENKMQAFPQRFIYHFRSDKQLVVSLNGSGKQEDIYYNRVK